MTSRNHGQFSRPDWTCDCGCGLGMFEYYRRHSQIESLARDGELIDIGGGRTTVTNFTQQYLAKAHEYAEKGKGL